jgi:hypothetical protein
VQYSGRLFITEEAMEKSQVLLMLVLVVATGCIRPMPTLCLTKTQEACTQKALAKLEKKGAKIEKRGFILAKSSETGSVVVPLPFEEGATRNASGEIERVWVLLPQLCESLPAGFQCVWNEELSAFIALCAWRAPEERRRCEMGEGAIRAQFTYPDVPLLVPSAPSALPAKEKIIL